GLRAVRLAMARHGGLAGGGVLRVAVRPRHRSHGVRVLGPRRDVHALLPILSESGAEPPQADLPRPLRWRDLAAADARSRAAGDRVAARARARHGLTGPSVAAGPASGRAAPTRESSRPNSRQGCRTPNR